MNEFYITNIGITDTMKSLIRGLRIMILKLKLREYGEFYVDESGDLMINGQVIDSFEPMPFDRWLIHTRKKDISNDLWRHDEDS